MIFKKLIENSEILPKMAKNPKKIFAQIGLKLKSYYAKRPFWTKFQKKFFALWSKNSEIVLFQECKTGHKIGRSRSIFFILAILESSHYANSKKACLNAAHFFRAK